MRFRNAWIGKSHFQKIPIITCLSDSSIEEGWEWGGWRGCIRANWMGGIDRMDRDWLLIHWFCQTRDSARIEWLIAEKWHISSDLDDCPQCVRKDCGSERSLKQRFTWEGGAAAAYCCLPCKRRKIESVIWTLWRRLITKHGSPRRSGRAIVFIRRSDYWLIFALRRAARSRISVTRKITTKEEEEEEMCCRGSGMMKMVNDYICLLFRWQYGKYVDISRNSH